jgi:hypothetical protein
MTTLEVILVILLAIGAMALGLYTLWVLLFFFGSGPPGPHR